MTPAEAVSPASPLTDALVEATQFGRRLFPDNSWCSSEDERIGERVRYVLGDGDETFPLDREWGWTYLLFGATGRAVPLAPGPPRAHADAVARACGPVCAVCEYCTGDVSPVAGLLPVPAGATVVVLSLCDICFPFLTGTFTTAHFISLTED